MHLLCSLLFISSLKLLDYFAQNKLIQLLQILLLVTLAQECWFCLGSPNVERHLVASVGEHVCDFSILYFILYNK